MGTLMFVYFCYFWVGRADKDFSENRKFEGITDCLLAIMSAALAAIKLFG